MLFTDYAAERNVYKWQFIYVIIGVLKHDCIIVFVTENAMLFRDYITR